MMKSILCVLFLLSTAAAFAQNAGGGVLSSQVSVFQMPSHPQRANYAPTAREQTLSQNSTYSYAKGERPLWEFAPGSDNTPLGDIARALKKDHAKAPKAEFVREN
ncbi:MAG TPA: hypothetical protein VKB77_04720 [Terriglobales bacterium]|nr:hypothetical protein [Terriglobales bacterium]